MRRSRARAVWRAGTLACSSALVVIALGCSPHRAEEASAAADECASSVNNPLLLGHLKGAWNVKFADYPRGAKPRGKVDIGELKILGCRYSFTPAEGIDEPSARYHREYVVARRTLPFITAPTGRVEVLLEGGGFGGFGLVTAPPRGTRSSWDGDDSPTMWRVSLAEYPGLPDYIYFAPQDADDPYHWEVSRGTFRRPSGQYVPGSDPSSPAPPGYGMRAADAEPE
jgi:hypothetical protein